MKTCKGKLLYFVDAMCSWCYAFDDEMENVIKKYNGILDVEIVTGGLHPYEKRENSDKTNEDILSHWYDVNYVTNKEFALDFFKKNKKFVYDTEPSSRAINAVSIIEPESTFEYVKKLHEAFYYEGYNPTKMETFKYALKVTNIDEDKFEELYQSNKSKDETEKGFLLARALGIFGFPALILEYQSKRYLISQGYSKGEEIIQIIDAILKKDKEKKDGIVE